MTGALLHIFRPCSRTWKHEPVPVWHVALTTDGKVGKNISRFISLVLKEERLGQLHRKQAKTIKMAATSSSGFHRVTGNR